MEITLKALLPEFEFGEAVAAISVFGGSQQCQVKIMLSQRYSNDFEVQNIVDEI